MTPIREARRADILRAADMDFRESGFDRARMENIARRAGIGKSTIYEYFQSKTDLFEAVMDWMIEKNYAELYTIFTADTSLRDMVDAYLEHMYNLVQTALPSMMTLRGSEPVFEAVHSRVERFRDFLMKNITEAIRRAVTRGEISNKIEPAAAALLIVSISSPLIGPSADKNMLEKIREILFQGLEPR